MFSLGNPETSTPCTTSLATVGLEVGFATTSGADSTSSFGLTNLNFLPLTESGSGSYTKLPKTFETV